MPPNIATLLVIVFIFILFIIDLKQEPDISFTLWIPLIWVMSCASKSLAYWLNPELTIITEIDYTSGDLTNRIFLSTLMGIGLFILYRRKINWSQILKSNSWILMLFLYMGLSIMWSDFMEVSFKRWIRAIGDPIIVLVVLTEHAPFEAIKRLFRRCAFVLLPLSVLLIKYFRYIGVAYTRDGLYEMWVGVTTHKNSLGVLSLVGAIFYFWNIMTIWRKKKVFFDKKVFIDFVLLPIALWLLVESSSDTSIGVFIVGMFISIMLYKFESKPKYIGIYFILIALIFYVLQVFSELFLPESLLEIFVSSSGHDMTYSGRTYLWKELIEIGTRHPIIGTGYGSFWIGGLTHDLWSIFGWMPKQGHNGYIDVYINLGLVGLLLLIGIIISSYKNIINTLLLDLEYGVFRMAFLVMILIHNITESSFTRPNNLMWFLFLLATVSVEKSTKALSQRK